MTERYLAAPKKLRDKVKGSQRKQSAIDMANTELEVELGSEYLISPIFLSIIVFISICLLYFYPVSLGSIEELKTHKLIYAFIDSENEAKEKLREELITELESYLRKTRISASDLYILANKFKSIEEFLITSMILRDLILKYEQ